MAESDKDVLQTPSVPASSTATNTNLDTVITVPPPTTPQLSRRDPSVPAIASTSKVAHNNRSNLDIHHGEKEKKPFFTRFLNFFYNRKQKTICERSVSDWPKILTYAVLYLLFLATWTMILLYISLTIIKSRLTSNMGALRYEYFIYDPCAVGLTAVPVAVHNYPLIWYRHGEAEDYEKYLISLDNLLAKKRLERASDLGPCGRRPYGYGDQPCVVVKINKQWLWTAKPLRLDSPKLKEAPSEVQQWLKTDQSMYWLHCKGYHSYDKEHIGAIKYYPDPPGFDASLFPLNKTRSSPMVAIQFSNFTLGISLVVECKLWFDNGQADLSFMLFVTPKSRLR